MITHHHTVMLVAIALGAAGCAIRMGEGDHYVGPIWFRYNAPPEGRAYITQVRAVGVLSEIGTPSGLTIGAVDRIAVAPVGASCTGGNDRPRTWRWTRPGLPGALVPGEWHFSPFYLRGEDVPEPCFTRRVVYGATAVAGGELAALSVGVTSRTYTRPPPDAVTALDFTSNHPLDTRFVVWRVAPGEALPVSTIREEVSP